MDVIWRRVMFMEKSGGHAVMEAEGSLGEDQQRYLVLSSYLNQNDTSKGLIFYKKINAEWSSRWKQQK